MLITVIVPSAAQVFSNVPLNGLEWMYTIVFFFISFLLTKFGSSGIEIVINKKKIGMNLRVNFLKRHLDYIIIPILR